MKTDMPAETANTRLDFFAIQYLQLHCPFNFGI